MNAGGETQEGLEGRHRVHNAGARLDVTVATPRTTPTRLTQPDEVLTGDTFSHRFTLETVAPAVWANSS
jgi:hypothetical protein